jgi:Putative Actinobacterial Holin-X, holin superfamily III
MSTPTNGAVRRDEKIGTLVKDLARDVSSLLRSEIALARAEMEQKGRAAGRGMGMLAAAAAFALVALGGSLAFVSLALNGAMPGWLAVLLATAAYAAIAVVLAVKGRDALQETAPPTPEKAIQSLKEDIEWARTHASSSSR